MIRPSRRAKAAFRVQVETLEPRSLLSADPATSLLVRFAPNAPADAIQTELNKIHAHLDEAFPDGPSVISVDAGSSLAGDLADLRADPQVVYAEPNSTLRAADVLPNDPQFSRQWGLNNANDVDIDAPQAWGITTGNPSTIVAILDSGVDLNHVEFAGRLWTNTDGSHGWNFIDNNTNVQDNNGHGTHVAGILGAASNNSTGVAGVNWYAQLMPLKVIGSDGNGSVDAAVSAIYYAVQHGARVINASWDGPDFSQALDDAIRYAGDHGTVFVAAAGNETANNDLVPSYPANDRLPNLISVAAVDSTGALASYSNYGATTVDLAAPGSNILSTVPGGYALYSGTSMAAPFVSGVASLIIGQNPGLTAAQVVHQILANVKPLPSLVGRTITGGMVDAARAVAATPGTGGGQISVNYATGLGRDALSTERFLTGQWSSLSPSTGSVQTTPFGQGGLDLPVPADYDGTGRLDYAVFRPTTAQWLIQGPGGGRVVQFGAPGDIPVPADYDGDGKVDIAVYRPSSATWFVLGSSSGPWARQFGQPGVDMPVPADYDGDGKADIAVFRPNTAQWFILQSTNGPRVQQFGPAGDSFPVPADYDGDGKADIAVFQPSQSIWYIARSSLGFKALQFGPINDAVPVPADYDNDGQADVAVYQPSTGVWYLLRSTAGPLAVPFGTPGLDVPTQAPIQYRYAMSGLAALARSTQASGSGGHAITRVASSGFLTGLAMPDGRDAASAPVVIAPLVGQDQGVPVLEHRSSHRGRARWAAELQDLALDRALGELGALGRDGRSAV